MNEKLIICGTGHRPASLPSKYGYNYNSEGWLKVKANLSTIIDELKPDYIISGMALGFDQYVI